MSSKVKPETAEQYFHAANELKKTGQLYTAMVAYEKALALKPDYGEAYQKLAEVYLLQGKVEGAIASCEKAIKINPYFAAAYLTLGNIYQSQKSFQEAIDAYSNFKLGWFFSQREDIYTARECYQKALLELPNYGEAYGELYRLEKPNAAEGEIESSFSEWQQFVADRSWSPEAIATYFNSLKTPAGDNYFKLETETDANQQIPGY